jgi:uncharacterized protein (TIGR03067 family)
MSPSTFVMVGVCLGAPAKDTLSPELKALQGEWRAVRVEEKGREWSKEETRQVAIEVVGNVLVYKRNTPAERFRIAVVDLTAKPAKLVLKRIEAEDTDKACYCIFALDEGKLSLCLAHEFKADDPEECPREFKTGDERPPSGRLLFMMERIKK